MNTPSAVQMWELRHSSHRQQSLLSIHLQSLINIWLLSVSTFIGDTKKEKKKSARATIMAFSHLGSSDERKDEKIVVSANFYSQNVSSSFFDFFPFFLPFSLFFFFILIIIMPSSLSILLLRIRYSCSSEWLSQPPPQKIKPPKSGKANKKSWDRS